MKIVILGARGQLGRQLALVLPGDVVALAHADVDLTDSVQVRQALAHHRPAVVINAAGYTHVDGAEQDPTAAFAANAIGVRDLAMVCRDLDCTLIHFSSDYVFGLEALRESAYDETDVPRPLNVYGASKLAGEQFVQAICRKYFILRTCGLYGPGGRNFVEAMLRQAEAGQTLRVVNDQTCTPTAAADFAAAVPQLLTSDAFGLYHVTNAGACTWHEFAQSIFAFKKWNVPVEALSSLEYRSDARRPRFSVLSNAKWIDAGFTPLRSWQHALESYLVTPVPAFSTG